MRSSGLLAVLVLAGTAVCNAPAFAQQAASRCEGTLCDLFYSGKPAPEPAGAPAAGVQPNGDRPLTVPTTGGILGALTGGLGQGAGAAPAAGSPPPAPGVTAPGEGGLIAMMKGQTSSRCTGTLCDLFYGGSAPEQPAAAGAMAQAPAAGRIAAAEPAAVDDRPRRAEAKRCVAPPNDPWRCYRH